MYRERELVGIGRGPRFMAGAPEGGAATSGRVRWNDAHRYRGARLDVVHILRISGI